MVHLAARVHQMNDTAPDALSQYRKSNLELTVNLAKTAIQKNIKTFVFISTVKVVGEKPGRYSESDACHPTDPYGISKLEAENALLELFGDQSVSKCIILRLPMVYGPGNKGNMLSLMKAAERRIPLPISAAKNRRSFIYVENICDAVTTVLASISEPGKLCSRFFIRDKTDATSSFLYNQIFEMMNQKKGTFWVPRKVFDISAFIGEQLEQKANIRTPLSKSVIARLFDEYRFSMKKFCGTYNWNPPISTNEGLKRTVEWYRHQKSSRR